MNNDDVILKAGNEPSEKTTRAMIAMIKADHPDLWERLKARELDMEAREDEYLADPEGFADSDPDAISEMRMHLAERFQLNSNQISMNMMQVLEAAFHEAKGNLRAGLTS